MIFLQGPPIDKPDRRAITRLGQRRPRGGNQLIDQGAGGARQRLPSGMLLQLDPRFHNPTWPARSHAGDVDQIAVQRHQA